MLLYWACVSVRALLAKATGPCPGFVLHGLDMSITVTKRR